MTSRLPEKSLFLHNPYCSRSLTTQYQPFLNQQRLLEIFQVASTRRRMAQLSVESVKITEDAASPLYNMAERGVLGGNAGKDYAVKVLEGGSGKAIAGHGV